MPFHAAAAAASTGIPSCRLLRPAWTAGEADRWHAVASVPEAPAAVAALRAERVFLTVGRQSLGPFASTGDVWFLVRAIEPHRPRARWRRGGAGPRTVRPRPGARPARAHRIDTVVTKNSRRDGARRRSWSPPASSGSGW